MSLVDDLETFRIGQDLSVFLSFMHINMYLVTLATYCNILPHIATYTDYDYQGFPLFPTWPGYWAQNRRNWKGGGKGQGRDVVLTSARSALMPSVAPYAMPLRRLKPRLQLTVWHCMDVMVNWLGIRGFEYDL